ncbi:MAG: enoyl-CoA hydratase/isomerase family protein, partial [Dehalococcoidia bacterium]
METGSYRGFETAISERGVLTIRFNRPEKLNGLDQWIKRDLVETLTQAQMDDGVRVVVFTGTGRAFCAGDDLSAHGGNRESLLPAIPAGHRTPIGTYDGLRMLSQPVTSMVRGLNKLTIAAMNGVAIQSGFSLALACDFRIASEGARMGSATLR